MFAILQHGGKQYKVSQGDKIHLAKLEANEGDTLVLKEVLLTSDGSSAEIGQPFVNTSVEVKVLSHGKDDKIRVFKKKSKKRYTRTQGHRQQFTEVEVLAIGAQAKKAPAAKKAVAEEKTEVVAEVTEVKAKKATAAKKEATEEKKPVKKVTAKKKEAA